MGSHIRGILWDLDGTLADTIDFHFMAWQKIFQELHIPFDRKTQLATFGMNAAGIIIAHLGYTPDDDTLVDLTRRKEKVFRSLVIGKVKAFPGVDAWLAGFQKHGCKQAVVSSAPLENIRVVIRELNFERYFVTSISGDQLPPKPSPDIFRAASRRIHTSPENCLVIEDAPVGIAAAHGTNMICLAVANSLDKEELKTADLVLDDFLSPFDIHWEKIKNIYFKFTDKE